MKSIRELLADHPNGLPATIRKAITFRVYEDQDKTEGRGGRTLRYVVHDEADATELAKGLGVMGYPGDVERSEGLVITTSHDQTFSVPLDFVVQTERDKRAALAAQALKKLTSEERKALGLA